MKPTASAGAKSPFPSSPGRPPLSEAVIDPAQPDAHKAHPNSAHDPEATALLRRYLAEIHGFREIGNQALRNLEARLAMLPQDAQEAIAEPNSAAASHPHPGFGSQLIKPSLPHAPAADHQPDPSLTQRLNELSSYLHADLLKESTTSAEPAQPVSQQPMAREPVTAELSRHLEQGPPGARQPQPEADPEHPQPQHKSPSLPVLDRAWFEERFAVLRTSIDRLAEEVPLKRIEALEAQFGQLMERLAARETARDPRPLEESLKALADYLADGKAWQAVSNERIKGVEARIDRLSALVAQSHAAISATAKGLEIVAKGTGENLARATAGIVIARLGEKIERSNPTERLDTLGREVAELARRNPAERLDQLGRDVAELARNTSSERLDQLSREVAHLTVQSRMLTRSTEDRLGQIEIVLKETTRPIVRPAVVPPQAKPERSQHSSRDELESYLNRQPSDLDDDYDSDMIAAAHRAARLADGQSRSAPSRPGPVRYQIPYGEFLPDEDSHTSRAGLIIAMAILLLAGAIMLFLKAKEWTLIESKPTVTLDVGGAPKTAATPKADPAPGKTSAAAASTPALARDAGAVPIVTGSTPAAPPLSAKPLQLWVASKALEPAALAAKPQSPAEPATDNTFREAAVKGDMEAQFSVGQSYLAGADGETNLSGGDRLSKAARWFRRAAEGGHAPSQYRLATLYELGQGVPRNLAEAETWYERAARQGHVKAMHNLAVLATSPNRRSVNYLTAAKWFKEAAAYGLLDSQFNLGVLYQNGLGLPKSSVDAYVWFALAARQRDERAVQKRDEVARMLSPAERQRADGLVRGWTPKPRSEIANRIAPEPPAGTENGHETSAATSVAPASAAVMSAASWNTDIAVLAKGSGVTLMVAEAQRLLKQMGYDPGPIDGVPGPRTQAAIRSFQRRTGLTPTGEISEGLIVKMAFLPL